MKSPMPHHLRNLFSMLLVLIVVQFYALVVALMEQRFDRQVMMGFCVFVFSLAVMKGVYDGMQVLWRVGRLMVALLLPMALFATGGVIWLARHVEDMGWVIVQLLTCSLLNIYVLWVLCLQSVKTYFLDQ